MDASAHGLTVKSDGGEYCFNVSDIVLRWCLHLCQMLDVSDNLPVVSDIVPF